MNIFGNSSICMFRFLYSSAHDFVLTCNQEERSSLSTIWNNVILVILLNSFFNNFFFKKVE